MAELSQTEYQNLTTAKRDYMVYEGLTGLNRQIEGLVNGIQVLIGVLQESSLANVPQEPRASPSQIPPPSNALPQGTSSPSFNDALNMFKEIARIQTEAEEKATKRLVEMQREARNDLKLMMEAQSNVPEYEEVDVEPSQGSDSEDEGLGLGFLGEILKTKLAQQQAQQKAPMTSQEPATSTLVVPEVKNVETVEQVLQAIPAQYMAKVKSGEIGEEACIKFAKAHGIKEELAKEAYDRVMQG